MKRQKEKCPKCGKKRWKFKSISRGNSPGSIQKWWECRDCGHRKYVYKK